MLLIHYLKKNKDSYPEVFKPDTRETTHIDSLYYDEARLIRLIGKYNIV